MFLLGSRPLTPRLDPDGRREHVDRERLRSDRDHPLAKGINSVYFPHEDALLPRRGDGVHQHGICGEIPSSNVERDRDRQRGAPLRERAADAGAVFRVVAVVHEEEAAAAAVVHHAHGCVWVRESMVRGVRAWRRRRRQLCNDAVGRQQLKRSGRVRECRAHQGSSV